MNKNLSANADSLLDKVLSSPRIKPSTPNFLILDGTDTGVPLREFPQTLKRKNAEVPDIYFTLLDAADITPSLVLNKNANEKERELGSFQDLRNKNCRSCTVKALQLMVQSIPWQRQANYQFQKCIIFFIQSPPIRDLTKQPENSEEWELSLDSKRKFDACTWHLSINQPKIKME